MEENISASKKYGFSVILKGMAMGIAEVIPGVSGGTIAFITGIYETLINCIKSVDQHTIKDLTTFKFQSLWVNLNGPFLSRLLMGMVVGIGLGVFGVSHVLEKYPEVLWAFFFGLILASVPLMVGQIRDKRGSLLVPFLIGVFVAFGITSISPMNGSTNFFYLFFAGAIAISALILPGISGSFMLLIFGLYTLIIPTLKSFLSSPSIEAFIILAIFGTGCLFGLVFFSRIISKAFSEFHDGTIALMCGFMLGSLNKIWPWRNPLIALDKESNTSLDISAQNIQNLMLNPDNFKILSEQKVLPSDYYTEPYVLLSIIAFFAGLGLIGVVWKWGRG